jgi:hypothetical protein
MDYIIHLIDGLHVKIKIKSYIKTHNLKILQKYFLKFAPNEWRLCLERIIILAIKKTID